MKFVIKEHDKISEFIELIKFMKNLSQYTTMMCNTENIHIQLLDDSHVSLLDINIPNEWFESYECDEPLTFSVSNIILSKLFALYTKESVMETEIDEEKYHLSYLNDKENKYFTICLIDIDKELLSPVIQDTDLDFSLNTSLLDHYLSDLSIFGEDLEIICNNDTLYLITEGDEGTMKIEVSVKSLVEFNVVDDYKFHCKYASKYLQYISKLKKSYKNVHLYLDDNSPLLITFNNDGGIKINYFIAPKINDD
jgi:proliferating cell nuclear antigen